MSLKQQSLFVQVDDHHSIHLRHIVAENPASDAPKHPVFMLHGAIENGKIFYTHSGKGLASFLAHQGYEVYVMDKRGRGQSTPKIARGATHSQTDTIVHDLPLVFDWIRERHQHPMHILAHSWGGVLFSSMFARFPDKLTAVASQIFFGTKRSVSVRNMERLLKVDLFWNRLGPLLAKGFGYLPAKKLGIGSDDETQLTLAQSVAWVKLGQWIDPQDGFNYQEACREIQWPPTWHIAAIQDRVLGHPIDVKRFMDEANQTDKGKLTVLGKNNGNHQDYDHINMLTHPSAIQDHFPQVLQFMQSAEADKNTLQVDALAAQSR